MNSGRNSRQSQRRRSGARANNNSLAGVTTFAHGVEAAATEEE
eukprot:COSAG02_NODE_38361_length_430_cov_0.561934_1_plen_42_part_10